MLSFEDFHEQIKDWELNRQWQHIVVSCRRRLQAQGYIELPAGSFTKWIEQEWFDMFLRSGCIEKKYDRWIVKFEQLEVFKGMWDKYKEAHKNELLSYRIPTRGRFGFVDKPFDLV